MKFSWALVIAIAGLVASVKITDEVLRTVTCGPVASSRALPLMVAGRKPKDIMTQINQHWKLQLPCPTIQTINGVSHCTGNYTDLRNYGNSPGIEEVDANELTFFVLEPTQHNSTFCSGGFYVGRDQDNVEMMVTYVPVSGTTTSGSENPRIEFRQMEVTWPTSGPAVSQLAGFSLSNGDGMRKLATTQSVIHVPPVYSSTSVVQIFNGGSSTLGSRRRRSFRNSFSRGGPFIEVITQKCQYSWQRLPDGTRCPRGEVGIGIWKDGKFGGQGGIIFETYQLGTKFDLEIEVPGDGNVNFKYRHSGQAAWLAEYTIACAALEQQSTNRKCCYYGEADYSNSDGIYFKVGNYVQKGEDEVANARDEYALTYMYSATLTLPTTNSATAR